MTIDVELLLEKYRKLVLDTNMTANKISQMKKISELIHLIKEAELLKEYDYDEFKI